LVSGISAGIDLYNDFRLTTARSLTLNSRVSRISDLELWLETSTEKSFGKNEAIDGSSVTKWYDINPKNIQGNYVFSNGNNRPKFLKSCPENNLPCLEFSSANSQYLESLNSIPETADLSIFFVIIFKILNPSCCTAIFASNGWQDKAVHININQNKFEYGIKTTPSPSLIFSSNIELRNKKFYIINIVSSDVSKLYLNRTATGSFSSNYQKKIDNYSIGRWLNGTNSTRHIDAYIYEIIIFRKILNDIERQDVENYLSKKWGIKLE
jgi:hypothetical protein